MKSKFWISGLFAAAVLAVTTIPATAANLLAYYPVDSYFYSGGVPYTPNTAPGSTWAANASLDYSGGLLYQNTITSPGLIGAGAFLEQGTQARLWMGTADPFAATGSFTYAVWMYTPATFTGGAQTFILSKFSANSAVGLDFKIMLRPTDMQFITWNGAQQTINTPATITGTAGGWNHFAITGSKSGATATWNLYENGNLITTTPIVSTISSSANGVIMGIGQAAGGQNFGFNGVMADDIQFYDGVLSQPEIMALVPEPSSLAMLGLGLANLLIFRRR